MKSLRAILLMAILLFTFFTSAQESLEIDGAMTVAALQSGFPSAGTIQWNGYDFLGWDGFKWRSLTQRITYNGTVEDSDGNIYNTIVIGEQEWMVENLRTTRYADNTDIPQVEDPSAWTFELTGAYCWYDNIVDNEKPYGALYNWFAVSNFRGLCPSGWRVPSDTDWNNMINFLNADGGTLKEKWTSHWNEPNAGATNQVGFTALPGGFRSHSTGASFFNINTDGYYWTSTPSANSLLAKRKKLFHDMTSISSGEQDKNGGLSVRCMRGN